MEGVRISPEAETDLLARLQSVVGHLVDAVPVAGTLHGHVSV